MSRAEKARWGMLIWRTAVLLLLGAAMPTALLIEESRRSVDTDAMLDVSVSIRTISNVTTDRFGDSVWSRGSGSGFLVDRDTCEVWTNHHVVEGAAIIEVFPRGWDLSQGIPATLVGATPRHDVAILRMDSCDGVIAARLGRSRDVESGDETYAVGNPLGRNPDSISRGIISHTERYVDGPTPYLQTDAAITMGNSGGALFNRDGEVVGMNSAVAATREGATVGIGYATPIHLVATVAEALKRGDFAWGDAGLEDMLSPLSVDEARVFGVPGGHRAVNLVRTPESGPAANVLKARDVIYRIADLPITDVSSVLRAFSDRAPDEHVQLHVMRDGEPMLLDLRLANGAKPDEVPGPDPYEGYLGLTLQMWSAEQGKPQSFSSPVITAVHSLGPAHRSLISSSQRGGAMNGPFMVTFQIDVKTVTGVVYRGAYHPIENIESVDRFAAAAAEAGDPLLLEIELWRRESPNEFRTPLERKGSAFYKVEPTASSVLHDELIAQIDG